MALPGVFKLIQACGKTYYYSTDSELFKVEKARAIHRDKCPVCKEAAEKQRLWRFEREMRLAGF